LAITLGDASYEVRYDPGGTNTDITEHIISIDKCTDVANEINTAIINLNSEFGAFITESNSGATPILDQWDKIKIELTDKNDNVYSRIFLVKTLFRRRTPAENLKLEVHMVGQEFWLSVIPFPKPFYFENAFNTVRDIIDIYNVTKGTLQASIENHDDVTENQLPQFTATTNTFGLKEAFCWDAITSVVDSLGNSLSNLGAGDFFANHFKDKAGDDTVIELESFSSGSLPVSPLTVQNTLSAQVSSIREQFDSETGTIVAVKGAKDTGSLPPEFAKFRGLVEAFRLLPTFVSGETYPANTWVKHLGLTYQTTAETTNTPPAAPWVLKQESDWIGTRDYSPWTNGNVAAWQNSGSVPSDTGSFGNFSQHGCYDANLVVLDEDNYQNWVHVKSTTDNFNVLYKYGNTSTGDYEGLRALVNGVGTGAFAGHDNKIMQYDGSAWQEIGPRGNAGIRAARLDDRVAIDDEGVIYKFDGANWVADHTGSRGNHCYHTYASIGQSQGVNLTDDGASSTYGNGSAVKYTYEYTPLSVLGLIPATTDADYYSIGAWANIQFPFPATNHNSQVLGSIYGGDSTTKQPATLDANNLTFTPTGKNGFRQTDSSSLLPLTGLGFLVRLDWFVTILSIVNTVPFEGNFKFKVYHYDTSDNVVEAEFTIPHLKNYNLVQTPFSAYKIYRARTPLSLESTISNLIVPELEVTDIFNFKDIKKTVIQWQEPYDEEGRYKPEFSRLLPAPLKVGSFVPGSVTSVELEVDGFHYTKQAFEIAGQSTTRPIFPKFLQAVHSSNAFQLEQIAESQLEIEKHRYRKFDVDMDLRCDIGAEHSFYLVDSELIADNDDASGGVKVVARGIDYTVDASSGAGGIQTHIEAVKRLI